jgi:hypothetical protein
VAAPGQRCRWPHLVIETAFRDDEQQLAASAATCAQPSCAVNWPSCAATEVCITHIKPGELDAVMAEVGRLDTRHHIRALCLPRPVHKESHP